MQQDRCQSVRLLPSQGPSLTTGAASTIHMHAVSMKRHSDGGRRGAPHLCMYDALYLAGIKKASILYSYMVCCDS